jgi:hypothetical protein
MESYGTMHNTKQDVTIVEKTNEDIVYKNFRRYMFKKESEKIWNE